MIDIHMHILPGVDDGAEDIYDAIEMARLAYQSGTTVIAATPHCNIPGLFDNYYDNAYKEIFRITAYRLAKENIEVRLLPAMEVYATEEVPYLIRTGKIISINHTKYLLIEFNFEEAPDFAFYILHKLRNMGLIPVVAHVERYRFIQQNPEIIALWQADGCEIQVNKGSFDGRFGQQAMGTAYRLLNHNLISVIASDAHSPVVRTPLMNETYRRLCREYPREYLDILFHDNPMRICGGQTTIKFKRIPFENMMEVY